MAPVSNYQGDNTFERREAAERKGTSQVSTQSAAQLNESTVDTAQDNTPSTKR